MEDAAIRDAVVAALERAEAATVDVSVLDAIAVLTGLAVDPVRAFAAEAAACRAPGVRAVVNRIGLDGHPEHDIGVARAALDAMAALPTPPPVPIGLSVREGVVGLHGHVPEARWRTVLEQELLQLSDVGDVRNHVHVDLPPGGAADKLLALLEREGAAISDLAIAVEGDALALAGRAATWFDRDLAERLAWSLPGVRSVANAITLPPGAVIPSAALNDEEEI